MLQTVVFYQTAIPQPQSKYVYVSPKESDEQNQAS